jgi:uncharacterized protein
MKEVKRFRPKDKTTAQPINLETAIKALEGDFPSTVTLDPFDNTMLGVGIPNYALDPKSFKGKDLGPIATPDQEKAIQELYDNNPILRAPPSDNFLRNTVADSRYDRNEPWIQTFSGRRFSPIKPNPDAIVIQDIAQALSNICRFTGHCSFYSVAQHSVLVSYICNQENALYGLLHDASEAYCQDIASPIKKTTEFSQYRKIEERLRLAVCKRFNLPETEPADVKKADLLLLATEARDLMSPLHSDWVLKYRPLPFKIEPLLPADAKKLFMDRFNELFTAR